jgi:hypothetical protein
MPRLQIFGLYVSLPIIHSEIALPSGYVNYVHVPLVHSGSRSTCLCIQSSNSKDLSKEMCAPAFCYDLCGGVNDRNNILTSQFISNILESEGQDPTPVKLVLSALYQKLLFLWATQEDSELEDLLSRI